MTASTAEGDESVGGDVEPVVPNAGDGVFAPFIDGRPGVGDRFVNALVGVLQLDVLPDHGDAHAVGGLDDRDFMQVEVLEGLEEGEQVMEKPTQTIE